MAKARRPPLAAAERFLGYPRGGSPGAVAPAPAGDDLPDLAEADVWYSAADSGSPCPAASRPVEAEGRTATAGGVGGRAARRGVQGGLSRAFGDGPGRPVAASAPVEVPAWPSRFAVPDPEPALLFEMEMDDGGADGWVPPHVYLARRQARASVVEGAGRTLKGRDMSRVRDAVWSRTGFDG
ncbi:uncharacterized protein LOC112879502 [Panicum hallii]|jgi:hypothetical protein|uniref:uncharacterized protein LOC112879502 n=1 Tax=Panicum hallii TaxID=206008 RepID=UPI000DF4D03D|nr:uncharacterized protein LOC112879502 [Panicum hallii]